jgi:type I restriction enzyme M protein
MTQHKLQLERALWNIANTLRGNMGADEFRDYILGFIFFKFLSEKLSDKVKRDLEIDDISFEQAMQDYQIAPILREECIKSLGYFIEPQHLFSALTARAKYGDFILGDLGKALQAVEEATIGQESEEEFTGLFDDVDLTSIRLGKTAEQKNNLISEVLLRLDGIDFKFDDTESDILGDAYEYLIKQFASGAGKKAGEFYTPQEVSKVLAKIVTTGKSRIKSVYDPTCGSGSLLLRVGREVQVARFYGQELNTTTYNLARMNMILHGTKYNAFDIKQGDTLEDPQHLDQEFQAVVANPPFSAHWSASVTHLSDQRFSSPGKLAPKTKADYAFVLHMLTHLEEDGTMAVVLPHGVLFRGASEGTIRKFLVQDMNYLDAVIGLPANIFYGTSIPTVILVFKKCRQESDDVLFIDASQAFEKAKNQNVLLDEHIDKIITTYRNRKVVEKYSYKASMNEIEDNDCNLNIPRYVDTFEEEEPIDIDLVVNKIKAIDNDMKDIDEEIRKFCKELGIASPVDK